MRSGEPSGMLRRTARSSTTSRRWATPKGHKGRPSNALTADQAASLLEAADGARLGAYVVLCVLTGIRTGEAQALRWDHVDLDTGTMAVWRSVRIAVTPTRRSRAGRSGCPLRRLRRFGSIVSGRRAKAGCWRGLARSRARLHDVDRLGTRCGPCAEAVQGDLRGCGYRVGLDAAGTADELREPALMVGRAGRGDRPAGWALEYENDRSDLPRGASAGHCDPHPINPPTLHLTGATGRFRFREGPGPG